VDLTLAAASGRHLVADALTKTGLNQRMFDSSDLPLLHSEL
jgi:hypothetical protein